MKSAKKCKNCKEEFQPYTTLQKYCSARCMKQDKGQKHIKKVSDKRQRENRVYSQLRKAFLSKPENQLCFIKGCGKIANTIEHTSGRIGSNFLDTSTWKPCCLEHNIELENNPELSKQYQLSKIHDGKKI